MSPLRALAVAGALAAAVVLQSAVLARLPLPGPTPDLLLLVVIGAALSMGANAGSVAGFTAGLLLALAPPGAEPLGVAAILYAVVGFVVGSRAAGERLAWAEMAGIAGVAGGFTTAVGLVAAAIVGDGWPGLVPAVLIAVLQTAYCALLAVFVAPAVSAAVAAVPGRA